MIGKENKMYLIVLSFFLKIKCFFKGIFIFPKIKRQLNRPPIIIGGCGRSGTTLLLSILSAHPHISVINKETGAFLFQRKYLPKYFSNLPQMCLIYNELSKQGIGNKCTRWCEKTPNNVLFFDRILNYFGKNVRLINIVRDGRDVILSKHPTKPDEYYVSIERWVRSVSAGLKFRFHPQVLTIRYEDLVSDYENTIREIMDFVGEGVTPQMLDWHNSATLRENDAWSGPVRPLNPSSIGKWRNPKYKKRVEELMKNKEAVNLLKEFGYFK